MSLCQSLKEVFIPLVTNKRAFKLARIDDLRNGLVRILHIRVLEAMLSSLLETQTIAPCRGPSHD